MVFSYKRPLAIYFLGQSGSLKSWYIETKANSPAIFVEMHIPPKQKASITIETKSSIQNTFSVGSLLHKWWFPCRDKLIVSSSFAPSVLRVQSLLEVSNAQNKFF